uniref:Uncharacterized protein AlNc14C5G679 n=1 Tax=Albugo laibachii Nc14 TaxID=890382 RepID=F0W0P4_9STRA|nr:conserved hypothetical protein [Albugo laibachii Nc14]|eukprot:CCA14618.1 conserved hypothetical protein [Albugo laibachii Nc14]
MRLLHDSNCVHSDDDIERRYHLTTRLSWTSSSSSSSLSLSPESSVRHSEVDAKQRRKIFWSQVIKQYNFEDHNDDRTSLLPLAHGVRWMQMKEIPHDFVRHHREIYYLISEAEYPHSATIRRDVTRTFCIFECANSLSFTSSSQGFTKDYNTKSRQQALFRVLNAIAHTEGGYCQGMNFIVAMFFVEGLEEADAYALFHYLLRKRHLARMYHPTCSFLDDYFQQFDQLLLRRLPKVHQHFASQGFFIPMYGIEWFTTLFSLSTKLELACAILDMFLAGVRDIFLRMGLGILELLEDKLLCMSFEDFLRDFKPFVRKIDPYQAVFRALSIDITDQMECDVIVYLANKHSKMHIVKEANSGSCQSPRPFDQHRTLAPETLRLIESGDLPHLHQWFEKSIRERRSEFHCQILANEVLHHAIWFGQVLVANYAIIECGAQVNYADDCKLTPLHFGVLRNQPDCIRLLLSYGADASARGGCWTGQLDGLTAFETCKNWTFRDTQAAQLVLGGEICIYCNRRLDRLFYWRGSCKECKLTYCRSRRGKKYSLSCMDRHRCMASSNGSLERHHAAVWTPDSQYTSSKWKSTIDKTEEEECSTPRTTSTSDTSSLMLLQSPMNALEETYAQVRDRAQSSGISWLSAKRSLKDSRLKRSFSVHDICGTD